MIARAACAFAALALTGCISLLPEAPPPAAIFRLEAGPVAAAPVSKDVVLLVASPAAPRSLSGADIVWRTGPEIAFLEGAAFDGTAPDILADMLIDVLSRSDLVRAAVPAASGVRADAEIRWSLEDFSVREDGALRAAFTASATLVDLRTRTIVDTIRVESEAPLQARTARAAAAALESAARDGLVQIAVWAAERAQPSAASTSR